MRSLSRWHTDARGAACRLLTASCSHSPRLALGLCCPETARYAPKHSKIESNATAFFGWSIVCESVGCLVKMPCSKGFAKLPNTPAADSPGPKSKQGSATTPVLEAGDRSGASALLIATSQNQFKCRVLQVDALGNDGTLHRARRFRLEWGARSFRSKPVPSDAGSESRSRGDKRRPLCGVSRNRTAPQPPEPRARR